MSPTFGPESESESKSGFFRPWSRSLNFLNYIPGHGSAKAVECNSKTTDGNCWSLIGISVTITLEGIQSFRNFDLETYFRIFSNSSSKF